MTIDIYTKAILTVIAVSLAAIAFGPGLGLNPPNAAAQSDQCGYDKDNPCYVVGVHYNSVRLKNEIGLEVITSQ